MGGFFEFEFFGGFAHLGFELLEEIRELRFGFDVGGRGIEFRGVERHGDVIGFDDVGEFHVHALDDGLRRDVVFQVVGELLLATAIGFADGRVHRVGAAVGVKNGAALNVAGAAAHRLDQRSGAAEEAFLIGVENGDERNFRQIEAFAQQVDADQDVEFPAAQIAKNLDAVQRFHFRMQIAAAHADF